MPIEDTGKTDKYKQKQNIKVDKSRQKYVVSTMISHKNYLLSSKNSVKYHSWLSRAKHNKAKS